MVNTPKSGISAGIHTVTSDSSRPHLEDSKISPTISIGSTNSECPMSSKYLRLFLIALVWLPTTVFAQQDAEQAAKDTAKVTEKETKKAAKETKDAGQKVGDATADAAQKTGQKVKKGTKDAAKATEKGAQKVEEAPK